MMEGKKAEAWCLNIQCINVAVDRVYVYGVGGYYEVTKKNEPIRMQGLQMEWKWS